MLLTFDDGPSAEWTPQILDLLAEHEMKATFFVIGRNALENPHHLRRIVAEGHEVGNHTWSHAHLPDLPQCEAYAEIRMGAEILEALLGRPPLYWRAPFLTQGGWGEVAENLGLRHMGADVCPDDFAKEDPEEIARIVLAEAGPDSVVCLHDGVPPDGGSARCLPSRAPTVEALRLILEAQR